MYIYIYIYLYITCVLASGQTHAETAQSSQWFFTLLFMCLLQPLGQTARCTQWLLLFYNKCSNSSVLSYFYPRIR